ncbi:hypothetical protein BH23GEM10_BH23GEM10_11610 [soil metagenome]
MRQVRVSNAEGHEADRPSRRFTIIFTIAMVVIALGWVWVWQARTARVVVEPVPAMAVVGVEMPPAEVGMGFAFTGQLAHSLSRIPQLTIVPPAELLGATGGDPTPAAQVEAARALNVPQVLQGRLRTTDTGYHLELQRLDAHTRRLIGSVTAEGATHARVITAVRAQLAMSLGLAIPE